MNNKSKKEREAGGKETPSNGRKKKEGRVEN